MSSFNDILQNLVNQDDDTKLQLALDCYKELLPTFQVLDPETNGLMITYAILGTAAAADDKLTGPEYAFIDGLLEAIGDKLSEEEILQLVWASNTQRAYALVREVRDHLNDDGTNTLINLIAAICSLDDRISKEEIAYIKSLF